jgi:hypothetical protein
MLTITSTATVTFEVMCDVFNASEFVLMVVFVYKWLTKLGSVSIVVLYFMTVYR